MKEKGHQQKHLVILENVQEVHDMAKALKKIIQARSLSNHFGKPFSVACFFTGKVDDGSTDGQANGLPDPEALEAADIVVLCRKYTTGWDEWRVCSIFLCRRIGSPEFLMQLLGRATRVKPGSGKKMPVIVDFMNDPT